MRLRVQLVSVAILAAAGPVGGAPAGFGFAVAGKAAHASDSVSPAASRSCGGRKGQRACRWERGTGGSAYTPGDYYDHDANKLPFGTERWRDQMRRENRLGNPG
jgi:hypothetical protein